MGDLLHFRAPEQSEQKPIGIDTHRIWYAIGASVALFATLIRTPDADNGSGVARVADTPPKYEESA